MCAPPAADPPDRVLCGGQLPSAPGPQEAATQAEAAQREARILRPHMPAGPGGLPADLMRARLVTPAADATAQIVVVKVRIEVRPAEALAGTFSNPREAHPRSPERVAAGEATQSHSPLRWWHCRPECLLPPQAVAQVLNANPNM